MIASLSRVLAYQCAAATLAVAGVTPDARRFGVKPLEGTRTTERAYTSPIWYSPTK